MAGPSDSDLLNDVARIRRVLARELETINEYEAFAQASSHPEVRAFFLHLAAEEKEHVSEATQMLRMLDSAQNDHFANPIEPGHFQKAIGGAPAPAPAPAAVPAPAPSPAPSPARLPAPSGNGGRAAGEPITSIPPQRAIYGLSAPPAANAYPLTVGSLRRPGGGSGSRGGER